MPFSPTPSPLLPTRKLLALTAAVALAHWALLGGLPAGLGWVSSGPDIPPPAVASFVSRTIAPAQTDVPVRAPTPRPSALPVKAVPPPMPPSTAPAAESAAEGPPVTEAPPAQAVAVAEPSPPEKAPEPTASPLAASSAAAAAAEVQHAKKVSYAGAVRLLYDGRGEEKGYIKYAASGELLWQPDAMQYSARLELSTFGFRVRTWTSKGELTDGGLQPTRFGDKPRGAEQATHFQRDKGIISFSANNPDVPLQPGAQDKLSALLQLSAMVAGDPDRYPAGSTISFQAADAHRAEVWGFKLGSTEPLDLPGGLLAAIKLTKEPTVEFDQRIEVWLAPTLQYLPVRLRITEANGAFADLMWRKSQKPD